MRLPARPAQEEQKFPSRFVLPPHLAKQLAKDWGFLEKVNSCTTTGERPHSRCVSVLLWWYARTVLVCVCVLVPSCTQPLTALLRPQGSRQVGHRLGEVKVEDRCTAKT